MKSLAISDDSIGYFNKSAIAISARIDILRSNKGKIVLYEKNDKNYCIGPLYEFGYAE